jgi:glycosyltransferase involved in cell wall biosynthesis
MNSSKLMKIGYVLTSVDFGGSDQVSVNFLRGVRRETCEIKPIVLCRPWETQPAFVEKVTALGYDCLKIPVASRPRGDFVRVPRCLGILYGIMKKERFELLHTHGYFADIIGIPLSRLLGVPVISTCHGFIWNNIKYRSYNAIDIGILRLANSVIAVSDSIKTELARYGVKKSKIAVIENGVDVRRNDQNPFTKRSQIRRKLEIAEEQIAIVFVGRLSKEKGLNYLLEACNKMKKRGVSFRLVIAGDGPQREEMEREVEALGIKAEALFLGFRTDVGELLEGMDIFVLPSLTEGTPMALLESMACGLPVIASSVGGVPKIVGGGQAGILVPPGDSEFLMRALYDLCINAEIRNKMGREALSVIDNSYSLDDWCRKIENLYKEVASERFM